MGRDDEDDNDNEDEDERASLMPPSTGEDECDAGKRDALASVCDDGRDMDIIES